MLVEMVSQRDPSCQFSVSALEIYFNDCYDLLNNKTPIAVSGFTPSSKINRSIF